MQHKVKMMQVSKHNWQIVSSSGHLLHSTITVWSEEEAKQYVIKYISSFQGWTYEVLPLKKENL